MSSSLRFRCENVDGVTFSQLKSGLQKAIRRGNRDLALRCARELLRFGGIAGDEKDRRRIRTNFLHRLMIIFLEDVGQEDLWPDVEELRRRAFEGAWPAAEPVYRWVALMTAAPKSRMCSHARAVASQADSAVAAEHYPAIAAMALRGNQPAAHLGRLLRRGLVMRATVAVSAAWALSQSSENVNTRYGRKAVWAVFETLENTAVGYERELARLGVAWAKELKSVKEAFLCWMLPVLARFREDLPEVKGRLEYEDPGDAPLVLPEYVNDMHVTGRKDYIRFALEGSHVENEDAGRINPRWKAFYMDLKFVAAGAPAIGYERHRAKDYPHEVAPPPPALGDATSETGSFQLLVRTQLTTSNGKTDVYFARAVATGDLVVVKGPYARPADAKRAVALAAWKRRHGLPAAEARVAMLKPDRWPEGVPLGVRNKMDRAKPAAFLVAKSLVADGDIPIKIHKSKVWPETEVVNWDRLASYVWLPLKRYYERQEKLDWVLALLYRYVLGLGDLADRNFMCAGGRLFSLDEDAPPREVRLGAELRKNKAALAARLCDELWADGVAPALARWGGLKGESAERLERARSSKEAALALFAC